MKSATALFNQWISLNALTLMVALSTDGNLDMDAFQDSYLEIAESRKAPRDNVARYRLFVTAYRKHTRRRLSESYSTLFPDELFFILMPSCDPEPMEDTEEIDENKDKLARDIFRYIRTFSDRAAAMLELYVRGVPMSEIGMRFGVSGTMACGIIRRAKSRAERQFKNRIRI